MIASKMQPVLLFSDRFSESYQASPSVRRYAEARSAAIGVQRTARTSYNAGCSVLAARNEPASTTGPALLPGWRIVDTIGESPIALNGYRHPGARLGCRTRPTPVSDEYETLNYSLCPCFLIVLPNRFRCTASALGIQL